MAMFVCWSPLFAGKNKKQSKKASKSLDGSKKNGSRRNHRVEPVDHLLITVTENALKESYGEAISTSFHMKTKAVIDDTFEKAVSAEATATYEAKEKPTLDLNNPIVAIPLEKANPWVDYLEDCSAESEDRSTETQDDDQTAMVVSPVKRSFHLSRRSTDEVGQAISLRQSSNTFSSEAHFSCIGLKTIPSLASFASLRSVNLSNNGIVQITPGSLPKSLHTLNLSRNKISTVDGLKDLERLRVLNLSYNRITTIGHGLSSCTLIKELYLAGNRIGNVDGLHRILKLTVLDLSFNKITTVKALGQLVANYSSLLALNLTGNPIQANTGNEQLKDAVLSLLPHVTYLNKQTIKPHKVRDVATSRIVKAALGEEGRSPQKKITRRLSQGSGSPTKVSFSEESFRTVKRRSKSGLSTPTRKQAQ